MSEDVFETRSELDEAVRLIALGDYVKLVLGQALTQGKDLGQENEILKQSLVNQATNDITTIMLKFEVSEIKKTKGKRK